MEFKILKIKIANIPINVQIDSQFKNIYDLISTFDKYIGETEFGIKISKSSTRSVKLSKNLKQIYITGKDIDDLTDSFNSIGIMQAVFRFVGIHSITKNIYLLHGSSSIINKKAFCFSDDGGNIGKTISSFECALNSKQYIGDEFCFLDTNSKKIFSYPCIPIHLRIKVKKHFVQIHKLSLPNTKYQENDSGYFIEPQKLFKVIKSRKLTAFIFPHFYNGRTKIVKLKIQQAEMAIEACISAHLSKLLYPVLDRMQFAQKIDSVIVNPQDNKKIQQSVMKKFSLQNSISQIAKDFPCYEVHIKKPCDIIGAINMIK